MNFFKNKKRNIIIICALVLVLSVIASFTVPALLIKNIKNYSYVSGSWGGIEFSDGFDVKISGSKTHDMLINSKNAAVAVASSDGKFIFNACSSDAAGYSLANVVDVRLRDRMGNVYIFNSTDNSVSFGTFEIVNQNSKKASVKFNMFPDAESARLGVDAADVFMSLTVDIKFDGTCYVASVDTGSVLLPKGFCLEKISILPGLFSVNDGISGENYIIPDGCGAVISLDTRNKEDFSETFSVYGTDATLYNHSVGAYLPFFAYAKNGCLVNTVITSGDALSEITFKKFADGGGYLYNTFTVTACGVVKGNYVRGESFSGVISQAYYVSQDITDYNAVAAQVRESLVAKNYIDEADSEIASQVPFFINLVGSDDGKNVVTSFEDATEITALLKSRGVKNITVRFSGVGNKGLSTAASKSLDYSKNIGGQDGYNTLAGKMGKSESLFIDYNMFVEKADYNKRPVELYSSVSDFGGFVPTAFSLSGAKDVENQISRTYKSFADNGKTDLCITDAASVLYTDVKDGINRQQMLNVIKDGVQSLDVSSSIMLGSPAVYLMKQADSVFSLPEAAALQVYSGVTAVPVLQMVIHGGVVYGTSPMNVTSLSLQDALLKCVEYGGVPSFIFTHDSNSILDYNAYVSSVASIYDSIEKTSGLLGKTMTSHQSVLEGVYKITYDYSKTVYVNYNPSVVEVNGILIPPKDFIII